MAAARRKTRRAKGDGTEWQDKHTGQWRWRIRKNGQDYIVSDAERSRAQAKFRELKDALEKKIDVKGGQQTLRAWMVYWLDHVVKDTVRGTTYNDYNKRCELYITPTLGDYPLIGLTSKLIRAWSTATRNAYALSSATQALAILTRALDVAVEESILEFNPARAVKPPRARADETQIDETDDIGRSLTPAQEQALLAEVRRTDAHHTRSRGARSVGTYVLYVLTLRLGFRRGEILGLRWKDIDLDKGVVSIRQQVNHEGQVTTPKSPKAKRALPLTDDLITMLREHKLKLGSLGRTYVFPDENGNHRKPRALDKHYERATKRAGITGFTFHDLRATAITRWREHGVDLEVAAALAGHATIKVTAEIYSDSTMERKRAAVNKRSG
jgi:integrase